MQYTGRERLVTRRTMAALAVVPAATVALLAVPATHDLVRYYPPSAAADPADATAQVRPPGGPVGPPDPPRRGPLLPAAGGRGPGQRHRPGRTPVLAVPGLRQPGPVGLDGPVRLDPDPGVAPLLAPEPAAGRGRAPAERGQPGPQSQPGAVPPRRADPVPVRPHR